MTEDRDISELMQKAKESLEAAKSLCRDGFYGFSAEHVGRKGRGSMIRPEMSQAVVGGVEVLKRKRHVRI
jgi:hypothetical protein